MSEFYHRSWWTAFPNGKTLARTKNWWSGARYVPGMGRVPGRWPPRMSFKPRFPYEKRKRWEAAQDSGVYL